MTLPRTSSAVMLGRVLIAAAVTLVLLTTGILYAAACDPSSPDPDPTPTVEPTGPPTVEPTPDPTIPPVIATDPEPQPNDGDPNGAGDWQPTEPTNPVEPLNQGDDGPRVTIHPPTGDTLPVGELG